jgi:translocator protein
MKLNFKQLVPCIVVPLAIGAISGIATATSVTTWFVTLNKPSFNPPNYLFAPVWTTLYLLMGVSFYIILQTPKHVWLQRAQLIFGVQLLLNFCWSFLFFKFHLVGVAFVEILLIWLSVLTMIFIFSKINKTAALLQVPYLLWVSFASVLNGAIWFLN